MKEHRTLSQAYPALVSEWSEKNFPFLPDDEHEDSYSKVWWKCPVCGHEWQAAVRSRAIRGNGCPCCAGKVIKEGVNDLASLRPDIAAEWSDKNLPLTPDQVTQWSSRSVWWKGECGHERAFGFGAGTSIKRREITDRDWGLFKEMSPVIGEEIRLRK